MPLFQLEDKHQTMCENQLHACKWSRDQFNIAYELLCVILKGNTFHNSNNT